MVNSANGSGTRPDFPKWATSSNVRHKIALAKLVWETPLKRLSALAFRWFSAAMFGLLLASIAPFGAQAEQVNCSLVIDSLETNITLSLRTAETLLNDLNLVTAQPGALLREVAPSNLVGYANLANFSSAKMSLVINDLNAMNRIGTACMEGGHYKAMIGQAKNASNIDEYLHDNFTIASSDQAVFLTRATAMTLLSRAISHKKNVLGVLVAEGYFLR